MPSQPKASLSTRLRKQLTDKKVSWIAVLLTALGTAIATAFGTWLANTSISNLNRLVATEPCHITMTAPITDESHGRRYQFLLIENSGDEPLREFTCRVACVRTVEVSEIEIIDPDGCTDKHRSVDCVTIQRKSIPAGGSIVAVIWHKLGGFEPSDVVVTCNGSRKAVTIKHLP